ncbi:unnamed protein product [Orchesella dallaii]|uniref:Uncharacterized protein n=1 Tax=Orchesella dallaii TaxID=48710 RepID=A0ABP1RE00_9HEXA
MIMAWIRIYSNDSTSCLKGWETCYQHHYYNTPNCWTGEKDDDCNDPDLNPQALTSDLLYYNFKCRDIKYYCEQNGWEEIIGDRKCRDSNGKEHTIYERRYHATMEFYYGAVCGIKRKMDDDYKKNMIIETQRETGKTLDEIRQIVYVGEPLKLNSSTDVEAVEEYLRELETSNKTKFENILENLITPAYQKEYWEKDNEDGSQFVNSLVSSSYTLVQEVSVTTWIMIAVFLFEDLLKISFLSYVLNAVPFMMLVYVTMVSVFFDYSGYGIQQLFKLKNGWWDLIELEMWAEAVVQVIYTTGIGNGVLISLATFNNFGHSYLL